MITKVTKKDVFASLLEIISGLPENSLLVDVRTDPRRLPIERMTLHITERDIYPVFMEGLITDRLGDVKVSNMTKCEQLFPEIMDNVDSVLLRTKRAFLIAMKTTNDDTWMVAESLLDGFNVGSTDNHKFLDTLFMDAAIEPKQYFTSEVFNNLCDNPKFGPYETSVFNFLKSRLTSALYILDEEDLSRFTNATTSRLVDAKLATAVNISWNRTKASVRQMAEHLCAAFLTKFSGMDTHNHVLIFNIDINVLTINQIRIFADAFETLRQFAIKHNTKCIFNILAEQQAMLDMDRFAFSRELLMCTDYGVITADTQRGKKDLVVVKMREAPFAAHCLSKTWMSTNHDFLVDSSNLYITE